MIERVPGAAGLQGQMLKHTAERPVTDCTQRLGRRAAKECLLWALVVGVPLGVACMVGSPVAPVKDPGNTPAEGTVNADGTAMPTGGPVDAVACAVETPTQVETGDPRCQRNGDPLPIKPVDDPMIKTALANAAGPPPRGIRIKFVQTGETDPGISFGEQIRCETDVKADGDLPDGPVVGGVCATVSDLNDGVADDPSSLPTPDPFGETANLSGAFGSMNREIDSGAVVTTGDVSRSDHELLQRTTCPDGSNGFIVRVVYVTGFPPQLELITFNTCDGIGTGDVGASTPVVILDDADVIPGCGSPFDISGLAIAGGHVFAIVTCAIDFQNRLLGARVPEADPGSAGFEVILEDGEVIVGYRNFGVGSSLSAAANGNDVFLVNSGINADTPFFIPAFIAHVYGSPRGLQDYTHRQVIGPGVWQSYGAARTEDAFALRTGPGDQLPGEPLSPLVAPVNVLLRAADGVFDPTDKVFSLRLDGSSEPEMVLGPNTVLPGTTETIEEIFSITADGERVAVRIETDMDSTGVLEAFLATPTAPTSLTRPTFEDDPAPGGGSWQRIDTPNIGASSYFSGRLASDTPGGARNVIAYQPSDGSLAVILRQAGELIYPAAGVPQSFSLPFNGAVVGGGPRVPGGGLLTRTQWTGQGPPLDFIRLAQARRPRVSLLGATVSGPSSDQLFQLYAPDFARTDLGMAGVLAVESFAEHPATGILYAGTGSTDGGRLHTVDPDTGALTLVGDLAGVLAAYGLAFDDAGQLWGIVAVAANDERWLAQIDETTADVTLVGRIEHPDTSPALRLQSLAFLGGRALAGAGFQFGTNNTPLVEIDTTTAQVVSVLELAGQFNELQGLDASADDRLFGSFDNRAVYEIDPDSGKLRLLVFAAIADIPALHVIDSDGDGRRDAQERAAGTRTNDADSDNDGLDDGAEADAGTDPLDSDSDDDLLRDGFEVRFSFNPLVADSTSTDGDGDGLDLLQEQALGGDPGLDDTDGDGLTDGEELALGTQVYRADSDGDGADDTAEAGLGTDPLDPDSDDDGIADEAELLPYPAPGGGTTPLDPLDPDTDGDTLLDGVDPEPAIPGMVPPKIPVLPWGALPVLAALLGAGAAWRLRRGPRAG